MPQTALLQMFGWWGVVDPATLVTAITGAATTAGMGLGWLHSHELRRLGEKQAAIRVDEAMVKVEGDRVANEQRAFTLYQDATEALRASNQATVEANLNLNEMRNEVSRLRDGHEQMRKDLLECIAARAIGAENIARLTAEHVEIRAETAELRRLTTTTSTASTDATAAVQHEAAEMQLDAAHIQKDAADTNTGNKESQ